MEKLTSCPVCNNGEFIEYLTLRDHFLSKEEFKIVICESCSFLFTNPRPSEENLVNYYKSDDYISHGKSNSYLTGEIYNTIRRYSFFKKHQIIVNHSVGNTILDVGCGTGNFLDFFKQRGWKTIGIEPAQEPREVGKIKFDLKIFDESILDEFSPQYFDVITLWHVFEHVFDINKRISQLKRILKNKGILVFALPNVQSWDCKYYNSFWAAWDVPRHLSHFSQITFQKLMSIHDLSIIDTIPMKFDSFYVSLLSEKYEGKRYPFFNAFFKGLKSNLHAKHNSNNYSSLIFIVKKENI